MMRFIAYVEKKSHVIVQMTMVRQTFDNHLSLNKEILMTVIKMKLKILQGQTIKKKD